MPVDNRTQEEPPLNNKQQFSGAQSLNIPGILSLAGLDISGLNGSEDPLGGLGAIMAVREQNLRKEFEKRDKEREYENLLIEKTRLESRLADFEKNEKIYKSEIEELQDEIDELQELVDKYEKLNPENSVAGVGLTGLGIKILDSLARKHSKTISKIANIEESAFLGMLDGDEEEQQQNGTSQISDVEITPVTNDPRHDYYDSAKKFMSSLSDEDFNMFWTLITVFNQDHTTIKTLHEWALNNNE